MEDRLKELKNDNQHPESSKLKYESQEIEIMIDAKADTEELMPEFRGKIDQAQRAIERINSNVERVEELKIKYQRATTSQVETGKSLFEIQILQEISTELNKIMQQNLRIQQELKDVMVEISKDVDLAQSREPDEPETRMKISMQSAITLKMQDALKKSQEIQMDFKQGLKDKISRQTRYLDSSLTAQQVEEICNDPEKANQLLQQKLYGQASIHLQNAVADIQDKYRDILKLEQSVTAVYQLFTDLALLVHNQGQIIDNIEIHMNQARNYVAKGEKQLQKAKEEHQSSRKKMCFIIAIGLLIILVIVGPVLGTQL